MDVSDKELKASKTLKEKLILLPVPALLGLQGRETVDTYAFERQMGCIRLQKQSEGHKIPISY